MEPFTKLKLSWEFIHQACDALAFQIKPMRPHLIVGISRGGLIPATMLSHRLNCLVETISASSYEGTRRTAQKSTVIEGWKSNYGNPGTLIVDDIMDTGNTFDAILYGDGRNGTSFKGKFCTLVKKTEARFINFDLYFAQVHKDIWIEFPWEVDES